MLLCGAFAIAITRILCAANKLALFWVWIVLTDSWRKEGCRTFLTNCNTGRVWSMRMGFEWRRSASGGKSSSYKYLEKTYKGFQYQFNYFLLIFQPTPSDPLDFLGGTQPLVPEPRWEKHILTAKMDWCCFYYSLLHLECRLILISNLKLLDLFSTEHGKIDLEN